MQPGINLPADVELFLIQTPKQKKQDSSINYNCCLRNSYKEGFFLLHGSPRIRNSLITGTDYLSTAPAAPDSLLAKAEFVCKKKIVAIRDLNMKLVHPCSLIC